MENCINCEHFAWWDGDYCCMRTLMIIQPSPEGDFSAVIFKKLKTPKTCPYYEKTAVGGYEKVYQEFLSKYESQIKKN